MMAPAIATLAPIMVAPRPLNDRLWALVAREIAGTATSREIIELNELCASLEAMEGVSND